MAGHVENWFWNGTLWVKGLCDAAGHQQVDVLTSGLPAGGATAALQLSQLLSLQLIDDLRNALGSVNTDDLQVDVKDIADGEIKPYGFDGVNWQTLLVEAAALKNLRVKLFDGANGIDSHLADGSLIEATERGLNTLAANYVFAEVWSKWAEIKSAYDLGDAQVGTYMQGVAPMTYNGATWDYARSWGLGVQKVGRAEIDSTTIRHTATGLVVAGAHEVYWIACSPSAANALWELSDDTDGSTAVVYDHFDTDRHSEHLIFDPPMKFATGIYIKTFTSMTSLVFCYV